MNYLIRNYLCIESSVIQTDLHCNAMHCVHFGFLDNQRLGKYISLISKPKKVFYNICDYSPDVQTDRGSRGWRGSRQLRLS